MLLLAVAVAGGVFAARYWWTETEEEPEPFEIGERSDKKKPTRIDVDDTGSEKGDSSEAKLPAGCSPVGALCDCCLTNQDCSPGDCDEPFSPDEEVDLRLYQVTYQHYRTRKATDAYNSIVTVCKRGTTTCADLSNGTRALRVKARRLSAEGLSIFVRDPHGSLIARWEGAAYRQPVKRRRRCKSMEFNFNDTNDYWTKPQYLGGYPEGKLLWIAFYLDPVDEKPARCAGAESHLPGRW